MTADGDGSLLVLYDAHCGICSRSAQVLRLDARRRLHLVPLQAASGMKDAPPPADLRAALHVRAGGGRWTHGAEACIAIGRAIAVLRPLSVLASLPGIRRLAESSYALVANNRETISRFVRASACRVERTR